MARAIKDHASLFAVNIKSVPVEALYLMSTAERYNTPVRKENRIVKLEALNLTRNAALQIAVNAVNDSASLNGLIPTLLV